MQDINHEQIKKHVNLQKKLDKREKGPYSDKEIRMINQVANFKSCVAKSVRIFMTEKVVKHGRA